MAIEIVTSQDLEKLRDSLKQDLTDLITQSLNLEISKKWLKSNEVQRMLKICPSSLQNLRDTGVLPFTKFGNSIYFDRDDIHEIMKANKIQLTNKI